MSYFNSNITGGSVGSGGASGLVTKFMKTIAISSSALAEVTIDISSDITNYKDITNDNIIIELNNASAIAAGDAELSHTYDTETGVITITSTNSNIPFASSSAVELDVNVYIAGAVQLPPAPVTNIYKIADKTTNKRIDCATLFPTEFTKLTAENFIIQPNVVGWSQGGSEQQSGSSNTSINYNATSGLLTWSMVWGSSHGSAFTNNYDVYCVLGKINDLT